MITLSSGALLISWLTFFVFGAWIGYAIRTANYNNRGW